LQRPRAARPTGGLRWDGAGYAARETGPRGVIREMLMLVRGMLYLPRSELTYPGGPQRCARFPSCSPERPLALLAQDEEPGCTGGEAGGRGGLGLNHAGVLPWRTTSISLS